MLMLYRALLLLYPLNYRRQFGEEMASVFDQLQEDVGREFPARCRLLAREIAGLLPAALREHIAWVLQTDESNFIWRLGMRRFPISAIVLMIVILAGVVLAIQGAHTIQMKYEPSPMSVWGTMPGFFTYGFGITFAIAVAVWVVLFALHRSGMHRLDNIDGSARNK